MGTFYVDCEVINIRRTDKKVSIPKLSVDTGSEFTWVPATALKQAGIRVSKKDLQFMMANGQTITRVPSGMLFFDPGGLKQLTK